MSFTYMYEADAIDIRTASYHLIVLMHEYFNKKIGQEQSFPRMSATACK